MVSQTSENLSRNIYLDGSRPLPTSLIPSNEIQDYRYTWLRVVPYNLFKQFNRVSNIWFLIVSIFELLPYRLYSTSSWNTIIPLSFLLLISLAKDIYTCYSFNKKIKELNSKTYSVWNGQGFVEIEFKYLAEGMIIKLDDNQTVPSDTILLARKNSSNSVFLDISSVIGTFSLEEKKILGSIELKMRSQESEDKDLSALQGIVKVSEPSPSYTDFFGTLQLENHPKALRLNIQNLLISGGVIKGTESVIGLIVYTGNDSKLRLNTQKFRSTLSRVEKSINQWVLVILLVVLFFVVISIIGYYSSGNSGDSLFEIFILFSLLYSNMVPISLFVMIDIVRMLQSFIYKYKCPGVSFVNDELNENLGQIEYLITDKSSTFSEDEKNVDIFMFNYQIYSKHSERASYSLSTEKLINSEAGEESLDFKEFDLMLNDQYTGELSHHFLRSICLCNNIVQSNNDFLGLPEEIALVNFSKKLGYFSEFSGQKNINLFFQSSIRHYKKVLYKLPSQGRNKCSVIVQDYIDRCGYMYTKGFSKSIINITNLNDFEKSQVLESFHKMSQMNLVPLIFMYKEIPIEILNKIKKKIKKSKKSLLDYKSKIGLIFNELEKDLTFLGIVGVKETLQENSAQTFEAFKKAGIKVWLTSSDSYINTLPIAKEIGVMTTDPIVNILNNLNQNSLASFIDQNINHYILNQPPLPSMFATVSNLYGKPSKNFDDELDEYQNMYTNQLSGKLRLPSTDFNYEVDPTLKHEITKDALPYCVVIDGPSLNVVLKNESCKKLLVCLLTYAKSVCFVEMMPNNKVDVIKLLKENLVFNPCVAAVGSGDSDFLMVEAADISIGVKRSEDLFVFNYTDVVVSSFHQLKKLIVFEGHYFYYRMTKVIIFYLYKNFLLTIIQVAFTIRTEFSGLSAYSSTLILGYNIFFTTIPILYIGVYDKDASVAQVKKYPIIYSDGIMNTLFSFKRLIWYSFISFLQSLVIVLLTFHIMPYVMFNNGFNENMDASGTCVYITLVVVVNLQLFIKSFTCSFYFYLTYSLSFILLIVLIMVLSRTDVPNSDLMGIDQMLSSSAFALFNILLTSIACLIPSIAAELYRSLWRKNLALKVNSMEITKKLTGRMEKFKGKLGSLYKSSESINVTSTQIELKKFSLKFVPEFFEKKYSQKFIKYYLYEYKIKTVILIVFSIIWLIVNLTTLNQDVSYVLLQVLVICSCLIFLLLLFTQRLKHHYRKYTLIMLLLASIGKLILDIFIDNAEILINIVFPALSFLEFNVHWIGICLLNIFNIFQSVLALSLTVSSSGSSEYIISSLHQLLLILTITISSGIKGYYTCSSHRKENLILKKIKSAFFQSSSILNMLLPAFVKNRVKSGVRYIADNQGQVTVIFIDICEFDRICADYSPIELTVFLDKLFSIFDKACENTGVAKIETVGKTYMACSGLVDYDKDLRGELGKKCQGKRALKFANIILEEVSEIQLLYGDFLKVKIGINTGLVTAGVVGYHKPQFSLVGDTVNTASRMCSTLTEYNSIQISHTTYGLVQDVDQYKFDHRKIEAKGKGVMDVYLVLPAYKDGFKQDSEYSLAPNSALGGDLISPVSFYSGFTYSSNSNYGKTRRNTWKTVLIRTSESDRVAEFPRMMTNFKKHTIKEEKFFNEQKLKKFKPGYISLIAACATYALLFLLIMLEHYVSETVRSTTPVVLRGVAFGYLLILCVIYRYFLHFRYFEIVIVPCILLMYTATLSLVFEKTRIQPGIVCAELIYTNLVVSQITTIPFIPFASLSLILFITWLSLTIKYGLVSNSVLYYFIYILFNLLYIRSTFMQERSNRKNFNLKSLAKKETKETKALLKKLMPRHIVKTLGNGQAVTDRLPNVTILYADIVGFTNWSSNKAPNEIVEMLSDLFTSFDKLCVDFDVYKVYTIGDCYVVIGLKGSGERNPLEECLNVVKMAFKMIEVINHKNQEHSSELNMRIGIHIGEVIGAVIGTSIVRYDIWGPDVLIANKMESNGKPGKIKASESITSLLDSYIPKALEIEESEDLEVKNLNLLIKTYFLQCKNIEDLVATNNQEQNTHYR